MTDEKLYSILYTDEGECNMSQDILDMMLDILREYCTNTKNVPLVGIDRWNLYCENGISDTVNYSHIHIVYRVHGQWSSFDDQIVLPKDVFITRWRDRKLDSIINYKEESGI